MAAKDDDTEPSQILDHVFLGSRTHARDKELLQRLRITHILNVTPPKKTDPVAGVPNFFEKEKAFIYRRCPIFDNKAEDISSVLEGCIAFIDQAKYYGIFSAVLFTMIVVSSVANDGRILVHCNKGVSRSTSMTVAYLMKLKSMSFEQALAFVAERRSIANPNESFRQQLQDYGRRLQRAVPKEKNARAARGPVGPSLPPAPVAAEESSNGEEEAASIGPQLPPHLVKARNLAASASDTADQDNTPQQKDGVDQEGKEDEKKTAVIGPSLPPHLKRQRVEPDEDAQNVDTSSKRKKADNTE
ncbi:hypothetical protein BBO99_00003972 [Phytophthora kernoviae]|uniref:protein-tyrosine-phosphatase n=2 Tax=Phytophthora kernoviae TaxID=325452 RepID=A0A3R7H0L9_9STRA|nr:hypothetical protein G195_004473 [Phytophthora kernoviae 00238/432]KAG2526438.1 hypothetical protein JM16_003817 [Phytophthora kernoviae]KAG2528073.1 hypothetical protein JM18_003397 [Phytophthora kernoviae]RLN31963.1 hypothetical protein BBI17_004017 [Phytophthora kernoviae]RLN81104.1 hypothetical protein BBO99_00003972 [Phytophthora kernoviae]